MGGDSGMRTVDYTEATGLIGNTCYVNFAKITIQETFFKIVLFPFISNER